MAHNPKLSNAGANYGADGVVDQLDNGYLRIYSGSQPTDADTAIGAQVKLAELRLGTPAFGSAVAGVATANAITGDFNTVAGTAAWFRILKSDGTTVICDGTVGTSGCDINLNTTTIDTSGSVNITTFTYTQSKS